MFEFAGNVNAEHALHLTHLVTAFAKSGIALSVSHCAICKGPHSCSLDLRIDDTSVCLTLEVRIELLREIRRR